MGQIVTLKTIYLKLADLGLVAGEICFLIIVVWFSDSFAIISKLTVPAFW